MNKKYNKAVFEFFTADEDRFLMMGKIAQHEPKVKEELIRSFWGKLQQVLIEKFSKKGEDWIIRFSDNWGFGDNKLMIYRESWDFLHGEFPLISIAFEALYFGRQPFIGVFVDMRGHTQDGYNTESIKASVKKAPQLAKLGTVSDNHWWPVSKEIRLSLSNYDDLTTILPKSEAETMKNLIADVEQYTTALDEFMNENDNL